MPGTIRLACQYCDTQTFDGIEAIPADWTDVEEIQSYEESLAEIPLDSPTHSPMEWYTHLGVCPECQEGYG